jgi:hypothetical protein
MRSAPASAELSPPPDPSKDQPGKPVPERITEVLTVLSILATYGRHLAETLEKRAVARGFATIAQFFGTATLDTILAHVYRGLMRAIALERMLLARAARGRDLRILPPRAPSRREPPATVAPDPEATAASTPLEKLTSEYDAAAQEAAALEAEARLARRIARNQPLSLATLPSMKEFDAEVLRSPVGRTIAAICRDFGISPSLCDGRFWNRLFDAIRLYRGSVPSLVLEIKRRERQFDKEDWKHPGLEVPEDSRDGIRRVLGFFIGESWVDASARLAALIAPVEAAATGPP